MINSLKIKEKDLVQTLVISTGNMRTQIWGGRKIQDTDILIDWSDSFLGEIKATGTCVLNKRAEKKLLGPQGEVSHLTNADKGRTPALFLSGSALHSGASKPGEGRNNWQEDLHREGTKWKPEMCIQICKTHSVEKLRTSQTSFLRVNWWNIQENSFFLWEEHWKN